MPGRTPYEAYEAFIDPLKRALACVAIAKFVVKADGKRAVDREHFLALNGEDGYVQLGGPARLQLLIRMRYMIIKD